MANPTAPQPEAPRPWYAGLIGFVFAALVLGAAALATAASYDGNDDDHGAEHSEDEADDEDHSEDEADDEDHSEDE